ncbi:hypothetical protein MKW94_028332 [Papaver nudicaule]|uniref:Polygalacturonase n=1 Tax=Papaver nudicaule TaxID=74823 RepID=A0AA41VUY9_PAPNU|nr:hypothetical protein [Papaver nudicaule]
MDLFRGVSLVFVITAAILFLGLKIAEGGSTQSLRKMFNGKNSKDASQFYFNTAVNPVSKPKPRIFDVRYFGAVGDGWADDTAAFTMAWKAACAVESGVVLAPEGYIFMINPTTFDGPCKGLTVQVDGVLMPPDGPYLWPKSESMAQWLVFNQVHSMTLTGNGIIEGNGEKWWDLPCKPHRGPNGTTLPGPCDSPALFMFFMSSDLHVSNLHIRNSPQFHMKFDNCTEVTIQNISLDSPALSPNTDGIHIEQTKSVGIYDTNIANGTKKLKFPTKFQSYIVQVAFMIQSPIETGDDCISIGAGCSDVDIRNITCTHSHGVSIGSLGVRNTQACVSNVTVRNVHMKDSDNGVRIKTWQGGSGSVSGVTFQDIEMDNVRNCIIVDQYYCLSEECNNKTSAVFINDISYINIKGTYDVITKPVHFACSDTVPCMNITMSQVNLVPSDGQNEIDPFCWNVYGRLETETVPLVRCLQEGQPDSISEKIHDVC